VESDFEGRLEESALLAFRVAYAVLRHREDAEDVAQETMARAYRARGSLRERSRLRAWIVRIAWRMALDRRRGDRRRERREALTEPASPPTVEDMVAETELRTHVWQAVDALPDPLRAVVTLSAMKGHDVREVAGLLEVPEGTVKSRLHQARKALAEKLRWLATETTRR
jgi:RNA polymerase sigma-70 factor (ECF subfamily)